MNASLVQLLTVIALLFATSPSRAATYTVDTFDVDAGDTNIGLAGCDAKPALAGDQCTLRAAVQQANAGPGADTIVLPLDALVTLSAGGGLGSLSVTAPVTITGIFLGMPADVSRLPRVRMQGGLGARLFVVDAINITLRGLVLEDGMTASSGGALHVSSGANVLVDRVRFQDNSAQTGGAIYNAGTVQIVGSDFLQSEATLGGSTIMNQGVLSLRDSSIELVYMEPELETAYAIWSTLGSSLSVENVSILGDADSIYVANNGGILAEQPALLRIRNSTLSNFEHYALTIAVSALSDVAVANSILAGSGWADCNVSLGAGASAAQVRMDWSMIGSGNCAPYSGAGVVHGQDPFLADMITDANSGRLTWYFTPSFASAAVDGGVPPSAVGIEPAMQCLGADQLGTSRPLDGDGDVAARCDMGAVEISTLPISTFVVTEFNQDAIDTNLGDNRCDADAATLGFQCTLRAAVMQANAKAGPDRIEFADSPGGNEAVLSRLSLFEPSAAYGDLNILEQVTIAGVAQAGNLRTAIRQTALDRIFHVAVPAGQVVRFEGLRLTGGASSGSGGAIAAATGQLLSIERVELFDNETANHGGALYAEIPLEVSDTDLHDNTATNQGGAIHAAGLTTLQRSSVWNNQSGDAALTLQAAVVAISGAQLHTTNSTVSFNSGGIWSAAALTNVVATTIADNSQVGLRFGGPLVALRSSVLAGNGAGDCAQIPITTPASDHYNLIADGTCAGGASNLATAPQLALALTRPIGSFTYVRVPLAGSPLIDAVPDTAADCPDSDQLGVARPYDGDANGVGLCDIGAVERATDLLFANGFENN